MALTAEWRDRIDAWRKTLKTRFYRPLGSIELSGRVVKDQLDPQQALAGEFQPMPVGTVWGAKWEYGWFRGRIALPKEAAGRRIVMELRVTNYEAVTFANGEMIESRRNTFPHQTLTHKAKAGETFDLLIEAYAWHGPTPCHAGPLPPGTRSVPEAAPAQQTLGDSTFGVWEEEIFQLYMDVETLWQIRESHDADSLRTAEIDKGLMDFTRIADFELPYERMIETVRATRRRLKPLLECRNGSTAPEYFCFGHAHLDVAWLWPLVETERKAARTLANQLALIEEYPEHRFLHSQPHLFRMVKDKYPALYERVKKAVRNGNIIADGGMWVESDTNITGGESLIRQFLHGRRFFREEFGIDSQFLWIPDVFGYSAALPQIMAGCGAKYFSTQKIFWAYHGGEGFPYHNFLWEGLDGTAVVVHLHHDYNSSTGPGTMIRRWKDRVQKNDMTTRLQPFGHGDGGGGPERYHLEFLRRLRDCEGVPRLKLATPMEFFEDLVARGEHDVNRYVGELYCQFHRGVLTSQAKTKRGNRKSELALREAELWGAAAGARKGFAWPAEPMDELWKKVLLNQFHDILPGSSIHRVYVEAEAAYAEVIGAAQTVAAQAAGSLAAPGEALTVLNSLNWARKAQVELPAGWTGALDAEGDALCVQETGGKKLVETTVPSCGWTTLRKGDGPRAKCDGGSCRAVAESRRLENDQIRVEFNDRAEIVSVFDKAAGRELLAGPSNVFRLYKDVPGQYDAWDIDSMYREMPVDLGDAPAEIKVVASGPLVATLRATLRLNDSTVTQEISLRRGARRVDFRTTVEWRECHKLLKICFQPDLYANEAIHEIQFGHIRRPNHGSRPYDADRFEVANHKWTALAEENRGFAVLNDCKYGVNVIGKSINLSLLRAPKAPDMTADLGTQEFTYAFYAWNGSLADSDVVRQGYELNVEPLTVAGDAGTESLLDVDAENIVVEAVKPAEDGSGDIIVRLYEAKRMAVRCDLAVRLPFRAAELSDMVEEKSLGKLDRKDGKIALDFRPFEVKTIRLKK
ncbi:MAG TPA: alpha-mannosidase [Phycisphaerales bacterium]|nr:alpha-mannosidase [Phycisphaerales bacterium]